MITDMRAAKVTVWEHQYLRILDVPAVLEARGYLTDGEVVFEVSDPYGYAAGRWHLQVRGGVGTVTPAGDVSGVPTLELAVAELSAMYLGGVRSETLVSAGRMRGMMPSTPPSADQLLAAAPAFLSIWY
jgi:predicted acetyltransferase